MTRALRKLRNADRAHRTAGVPIDEIDIPDARAAEAAQERLWNDLWERQRLHRILDLVRERYRRRGRVQTFIAFERNVLFGEPPEKIAAELGISVTSVHMAKMRVTKRLAEERAKYGGDDDW